MNFALQGDGSQITVEPGLIGGEINTILANHKKKHNHPIQYKIGPDPSSIDSCMVGGIVANNSSGMCCGVSQNTYHTLKDMRIVFSDGSLLDTANAASRSAFLQVISAVGKSGFPGNIQGNDGGSCGVVNLFYQGSVSIRLVSCLLPVVL